MAAASRPWSEPEMEAAKSQSVVCRSDSAIQKPRRARRETVLRQSPRREELPTQQRGGATWSAQRSALCMEESAAATVPPREARDKYWHRGDKRRTRGAVPYVYGMQHHIRRGTAATVQLLYQDRKHVEQIKGPTSPERPPRLRRGTIRAVSVRTTLSPATHECSSAIY